MHPTPKFRATVRNQFKCPIGYGAGETREAAVAAAHVDADRALRNANRAWKWRKARTDVEQVSAPPACETPRHPAGCSCHHDGARGL